MVFYCIIIDVFCLDKYSFYSCSKNLESKIKLSCFVFMSLILEYEITEFDM